MKTFALTIFTCLLASILTACVVTPAYYREGLGHAYPAGSAWVPGHYSHNGYWVRGHWR